VLERRVKRNSQGVPAPRDDQDLNGPIALSGARLTNVRNEMRINLERWEYNCQ
jgi:hypothetical protein